MLKIVGTGVTALFLAALPFSFDGVTPTVSKAHARIGRPFTPLSIAGVHRRAMRRTYGVGANLGYHPVARAAVYGAAAYGAGWNGGWGFNRPLYGYAGTAPGWNGGLGFNRPLYGYAGTAPGWGGGWGAPGWGGGWRLGWGW
jgi:hypothetical protein